MLGGRSALLGAAGSGNPYGNWTGNYSDVSLLLRNGTLSTVLIPLDESPSPKTVTALGNAQNTTAVVKYGTSSMVFDGTDDRLTIPTNIDLSFGTGDFTIDGWFLSNDASFSSQRGMFQTSATVGGLASNYTTGVVFYHANATELTTDIGGTSYTTSGAAISNGSWFHFAITRRSGNVNVYINGTSRASGAGNTTNLTGTNLVVGGYYSTSHLFNGYIDDLRITKGVARYTANFTPPTAELPANITDDPSYNSVSLLLRNGTPKLILLDESPSPKTVTAVDNAAISTSIKQYGTSSMVFDGSGDYFSSPTNADFDFGTGDFTIECWVNLNTLATDQAFVTYAAGNAGSNQSFSLERLTSGGVFRCYIYSGSSLYGATVNPVISTGTWYHVAGVRSGGQLRCYVNGVGGTAVNANVSVNAAAGRILTVGSAFTSLRFTNGYIDDLRITKGVARYTKNFLPPPAELPAI